MESGKPEHATKEIEEASNAMKSVQPNSQFDLYEDILIDDPFDSPICAIKFDTTSNGIPKSPLDPDSNPKPSSFDDILNQTTNIKHSDVGKPIGELQQVIFEIKPKKMKSIRDRGHIDGGALATTTNDLTHVFNYLKYTKDFKCPVRLVAADNVAFVPQGRGYLHIPLSDGSTRFYRILCYYCPQIPSCIISPHSFKAIHTFEDYCGFIIDTDTTTSTCVFTSKSILGPDDHLRINGVVISDLCYSPKLLKPGDSIAEIPINALNARTSRLLWHQRLGHVHDALLEKLHNHTEGIPKFSPKHPILDSCPTCLSAKIHKKARSKSKSTAPQSNYAALSMDFGFVIVESKETDANGNRVPKASRTKYKGINGETCYILAVCHLSNELQGSARVSKAPPFDWLRAYLNRHANPSVPNKYVLLDQGGELGRNRKIKELFAEYGYSVYLTGAESSSQNGKVERPHRTLADMMRAMLTGGNMDFKFWPFCFRHAIRILNALPNRGYAKSAIEVLTGKKPNMSNWRTIGCRVIVRKPGRRSAKLDHIDCRGIFLGYLENTTKNIIWFDETTSKIKISYHGIFDEAMSDLPVHKLPPNVTHLQRVQDRKPNALVDLHHSLKDNTDIVAPIDLEVVPTPFTDCTVDCRLRLSCNHFTLGFILRQDKWTDKPYISDILDDSSAWNLPKRKNNVRHWIGALIIGVDDVPIFSAAEVKSAIATFRKTNSTASHIPLTLALSRAPTDIERSRIENERALESNSASTTAQKAADQRSAFTRGHQGALVTDVEAASPIPINLVSQHDLVVSQIRRLGTPDHPDNSEVPTLSVADIRHIHFVRTGDYFNEDQVSTSLLKEHMADCQVLPSPPPPEPTPLSQLDVLPDGTSALRITALSSEKLTSEERSLGTKFSRTKLRALSKPTWEKWQQAEWKQLDQFHTLDMFGPPCPVPKDATVIRMHWVYKMKEDGTRRSRACGDGSKRAVPALYKLLDTYHSCLAHPMYRLHLALCALHGLTCYSVDIVDAYGHSDGPPVPCYVRVDQAYRDWWFARFSERLPSSELVLPMHKALQGHPHAGKSYENKITEVLKDLNFKGTTHERNILTGSIDGELCLIARQIDDFSIGTKLEATARKLATLIGQRLQAPKESKIPIKFLGLLDKFVGTDVLQTRAYTKLSCTSYINRLMVSHGWQQPSASEGVPQSRPFEPIPSAIVPDLYTTTGPLEGSPAHKKLASSMGFGYRTLLGELMFAYVMVRLDIGYAVTTLSKFSTCPSTLHYTTLKRVALYLRHTKDWGILYWRKISIPHLPDIPFQAPEWDSDELFDLLVDLCELAGFVDAAYATDLRNRRSTAGFAFCLAGGAIAWRALTQPVVATSSTESEFIAAVMSSKTALYLRSVLFELGFGPTGPTPLYEDNEPAIRMVNANRPTERSRHIDIAWFAIQSWRERGDIVLRHVKGTLNPSDDFTKALGWVLHARHSRRMMGHFYSQSSY